MWLAVATATTAAVEPIDGAPEFDSEITLCCKLLNTQGKLCGWEAGIRTPRYRRFQITDGVRVVVTTRSVLASSGSE
jgi:hypothetical protein